MKLRQSTLALLLTLSAAGTILNPSAARANDLVGKADGFLTKQAARHVRHSPGRTSVIVKTEGDLTPEQAKRLRTLGADIYRHLPIIHSLALSLPSRNLDKLAALPFVQHLSSDLSVKKCDEFTVETSGAQMVFDQQKLDGTGVGVAVVDSGIHASTDFGAHLGSGVNFVPTAGRTASSTEDTCGHGTHVAGIIAGNGSVSSHGNSFRTFFGIARNAQVVPVRVLDANGQGTVSQVVSGIQWAVSNRTKYNIRVMNLSLGHPVGESYTTDPLCQAVESAWKSGIVVVCSAGNNGRLQNTVDPTLDNEGYGSAYGSIQSPGNDPYVITVGAMKAMDLVFAANGTHTHNRANDRVATYSSRGPSRLDFVLKPDIMAPGNKVISVEADGSSLVQSHVTTNEVPVSDYAHRGNTKKISEGYFRLSGTSMAAPVVAGAAALMLQKDAKLTPDTIKARLMLSADKWAQPDGTVDPLTFGAGYLNIPAALASTAVPGLPANSPSLSFDGNGSVSINMDRAIWVHAQDGSVALWGMYGVTDLRAIWGHDSIAASSTNLLSASRAIWGHSVDAERAIWGHSVWEDRAIWGHSVESVDLSSTTINGE